MRITLFTFIVLLIISACTQVPSPALVSATVASPTFTRNAESHTPQTTLIPSKTLYPTPTEWIKIYQTKKASVIYGTSGRNEYTINFIEWGDFYLRPYLVLYEDGQLMFGLGGSVKQLSKAETKEIFIQLEQLGVFRSKTIVQQIC